ncbi:MAG: NAD(+)/NADH kinase [Planctomycetes bacterium]|nr:NAD(+)/NADH kinase [Planctomycetota bacterium]
MKIARVLLVGEGSKPGIRRALDELNAWLRDRVEVAAVCDSTHRELDPGPNGLVVILGGDGAILSAAARLGGRPAPCIGIHLGRFGFLAELEPSTCRPYLERLFAGEGEIVERLMLRCEVLRQGKTLHSELALNDAVVTARAAGRMLAVDLEVDGQLVANYRGDGLIISTPVGSTAYSLAAGGPVVEPDSDLILVTPLAPHTLSSRPLVLDSSRLLAVRLARGQRRAAALVLDGQRVVTIRNGDLIRIRRSERPLRFVSIVERSFFQTLREKFRWGGSVPLNEEGERGKARA